MFSGTECSDLVCKKSAIDAFAKVGRAFYVEAGPITISGVGDNIAVSVNGIKVTLPFEYTREAMCETCLDTVTAAFPVYDLSGVEPEACKICLKDKGESLANTLPNFPPSIGGATDIMVGVKYLKYFPKAIYRLPSGLTVFESVFVSMDGTKCVVGGLHDLQKSEGSSITKT